jgi:hypothetical protein
MKRLKIISDVVTSRGIFLAGSDVSLEDAEAESCIKNGQAELVSTIINPNLVRPTDDFKSKVPTHRNP